tara:strand:- start:286 stop:573 length:288 start_codon:yes stop_codon:yes gene_type:complete
MAHHQDGSSVQKHSAGSHYPFIVGVQEHVEGNTGYAYVLAPDGNEVAAYAYDMGNKGKRVLSYERAFAAAEACAAAYPARYDTYVNAAYLTTRGL